MALHYTFQHELDVLNKKLMHMTSLVEDRVRRATAVIESYGEAEIKSIIRNDYEIDELEVEIEEDCLKVLALHQPVATDLRFLIAVIKINNELERIADTAVGIAMRVKSISSCNDETKNLIDYRTMSHIVLEMLKMSIDALVTRDSTKARRVFFLDDDVDALRDKAYDNIKNAPQGVAKHPGCLINVYLIARHLERIADRATNIAEEVVHLVEGDIVRS